MGDLPAWWGSSKPWRICDVLDGLRSLPDNSVQCVVTSPPYWGLRDYGVEGQLGLEKTPELYVAKMTEIFREVKRVLRDDGTCWLNLGDSYVSNPGDRNKVGGIEGKATDEKKEAGACMSMNKHNVGLKPKDLVGIPWRVAFALQADGWYLRSDIIWHKPNPMPESVTDRPTKSHEYIFLLTKSARYFYDNEAVKETAENRPTDSWEKRKAAGAGSGSKENGHNSSLAKGAGFSHTVGNGTTRNARSVWSITTKPFKGAHFATFPPELPTRCIKAGTSEKGACPKCGVAWERVVEKPLMPIVDPSQQDRYGNGDAGIHRKVGQKYQDWRQNNPDKTIGWQPTCSCGLTDTVPCIVLDIFAGSGTTMVVAEELGRIGIGIDLNENIAEHYRNRKAKKDVSKVKELSDFQDTHQPQASADAVKPNGGIYSD